MERTRLLFTSEEQQEVHSWITAYLSFYVCPWTYFSSAEGLWLYFVLVIQLNGGERYETIPEFARVNCPDKRGMPQTKTDWISSVNLKPLAQQRFQVSKWGLFKASGGNSFFYTFAKRLLLSYLGYAKITKTWWYLWKRWRTANAMPQYIFKSF